MKRLGVSVLALVVAGTGMVATTSAAEAATSKVTIKKIGTKRAGLKNTATIKPSVSKSGKIEIRSSRITVKKGSKTVRKNVTSAKLKPGTYKVTTTVKYRSYRDTYVTERRLEAAAGSDYYGWCQFAKVDLDAKNFALRCVPSSVDLSDFGIRYLQSPLAHVVTGTFTDATDLHLDTRFGGRAIGYYQWWSGGGLDPIDSEFEAISDDSDLVDIQSRIPRVAAMDSGGYYPKVHADRNIYVDERVYKTLYGKTRVKTRTQTLRITKARKCATLSDFRAVKASWDDPAAFGDTKGKVSEKLNSYGVRYYHYEDEDGRYERRYYNVCNSDMNVVSVRFENGYAYHKTFSDVVDDAGLYD